MAFSKASTVITPTSTSKASAPRRSRFAVIHLYAGLTAAFFVVLLGLSGALLAFQNEIDRALNPKLSYVQPTGQPLPLAKLAEIVSARYPGNTLFGFQLPEKPNYSLVIAIGKPNSRQGLGVVVNQYTGEILGDTEHSNNFMQHVREFHSSLLLGGFGEALLWFCAVFLVGLSISGLVLWWKRKRFSVKGGTPSQVFALDLHSAIGIYFVLFVFIFGFTAIRPIPVGLTYKLPWTQPGFGIQKPQPNAVKFGPEELLRIAQATLPGANPAFLGVTAPPDKPIGVLMRYPEDRSERPRSVVWIDPFTGNVVAVMDLHKMDALAKYAFAWNWEIHTGTIFGRPSQIAACVLSLGIPILALTGILVWWRRRQARISY